MARDIESLKKSIDRILPSKDRSYTLIEEKTAIVRMGDDLFVCDVQENDPESCMLRNKICEVDDETFSKVEDYVKQEIENIENYTGKSSKDDFIPGFPDKPKILTEEQKRQQKIDGALIPGVDDDELKDDENSLIPD